MSSESLSLPEQKLANIDTVVRSRPEIAGFQGYEYFRSDIAAQTESFINGGELTLQYPDLTSGEVYDLAYATRDALVRLMPGEDNEKSRALYNAIEYRFTEMYLVDLASRLQKTDLSEGDRTELITEFKRASEALYGKPDKAVFSALANKHLTPLLEVDYDDPTVGQIKQELGGLLGQVDDTGYELYVPSEETLDRISNFVNERFARLLDHIDPDKTYTPEEMVPVIEESLRKLGDEELGWKVELVENSSALAVSAHRRTVEVGINRKTDTGDKLAPVVLHEVGVHALRSIIAEQAGWLSAAYGQEGYLDFEEAFATALQDAYSGKFADHGVEHYLTAGLAYGLDNHEARDFRDVYEILWRKNVLKESQAGTEVDHDLIDESKKQAVKSATRLFRGTSTRDKGVIYLKDLAYFAGQEKVWEVLDGVMTQEDMDLLFAGKLDNSRPDHQSIARQIVKTT